MLYPLKFKPILKEKIWGGDKLRDLLNRSTEKNNTGESWEISTVENDISIASNGELRGRDLIDLIKEYKDELVGKKVYNEFGDQFPLLIKFIDAKEDLSVQLHPNDELAKKRHNSFGKTEMWYVVDANKESNLIIGFNKNTSREEYINFLDAGNIEDLLNKEKIEKGDAFFIKTGTIHAICKGTLIAEIQQTSDITYRVYDWNRTDDQGNVRELHTEMAIDALDYNSNDDYKKEYDCIINAPSQIVSCDYFTANILKIRGKLTRNYKSLDSFKIYMCVEGRGRLVVDKTTQLELMKGETVLIPAVIDEIHIEGSEVDLLEIYIM